METEKKRELEEMKLSLEVEQIKLEIQRTKSVTDCEVRNNAQEQLRRAIEVCANAINRIHQADQDDTVTLLKNVIDEATNKLAKYILMNPLQEVVDIAKADPEGTIVITRDSKVNLVKRTFPPSPTDGQTFTNDSEQTYVYSAPRNAWVLDSGDLRWLKLLIAAQPTSETGIKTKSSAWTDEYKHPFWLTGTKSGIRQEAHKNLDRVLDVALK